MWFPLPFPIFQLCFECDLFCAEDIERVDSACIASFHTATALPGTVKGFTGASREKCGGVFVFGMEPVHMTSSCTTISSTLVSWRGSRGGLFKFKIPGRPWQSSVSTCVSILQSMKKTVIAKLCPGVNDFLTQQDFI